MPPICVSPQTTFWKVIRKKHCYFRVFEPEADSFLFEESAKAESVADGNALEKPIMMYLKVFLKVCEGCGCLWYRAQGNHNVYCAQCANRIKDFPKPTRKTRGRRPGQRRMPVCRGGEQ